jgi:hypothetical protein
MNNNTKRAVTVLLSAVAAVAIAMFLFYFVKDRTHKPEGDIDLNQKVESAPKEEKSEFVGVYSPLDGPMEANGKRLAFFTVNRRDEGGYLGSAKVDTIGEQESVFLNCVDVRIEEKDFFLKCVDEKLGVISLNGHWQKSPAGIQVIGQVFWSKDGNAFLDQANRFALTPQ